MQRLPSINPFDTGKYPNGIGTFNVGAADDGSKILFYNESPANIDLDFLNGSTDVLHAWEANFWTLDADTKQIEWQIDANSLNVSTPPVSAIFMTLYAPSERIGGTYPMALIRQASVGNLGGIQTSNVAQVINDGQALQQVIEATLLGHSSSDVIINNDGSFTLKGAGLIAAVGVLTHILGDLNIDGSIAIGGQFNTYNGVDFLFNAHVGNQFLFAVSAVNKLTVSTSAITALVNFIANGGMNINTIRDNVNGNPTLDLSKGDGSISFPNGNIYIGEDTANTVLSVTGATTTQQSRLQAGQQVRLQVPGGTDIMTLDTTINAKVNVALGASANVQYRNGNTEHNISTCSFSATGTVNHNLGETPFDAYITCQVSGSETVGYDSLTSTTAHVTLGAALSAKAIWRV